VFAPETLGHIVYLHQHIDELKQKTIAAFNLTCVGDNRNVSLLPSRQGDTLADRVARHVLKHNAPEFREYQFLKDRASSERQYCSPGVDIPMVSIMRSKYLAYPEYHTSLDDLSVVSAQGLQKSFDLHRSCVQLIEKNAVYQSNIIGEPHLARRGIINNLGSGLKRHQATMRILDIMVLSDGNKDLLSIADATGVYMQELLPVIELLLKNNLIKEL
jgi:aminopeptidase-like protein